MHMWKIKSSVVNQGPQDKNKDNDLNLDPINEKEKYEEDDFYLSGDQDGGEILKRIMVLVTEHLLIWVRTDLQHVNQDKTLQISVAKPLLDVVIFTCYYLTQIRLQYPQVCCLETFYLHFVLGVFVYLKVECDVSDLRISEWAKYIPDHKEELPLANPFVFASYQGQTLVREKAKLFCRLEGLFLQRIAWDSMIPRVMVAELFYFFLLQCPHIQRNQKLQVLVAWEKCHALSQQLSSTF